MAGIDILGELATALVQSFRNLGIEAARVIPGLLGALILVIIGIALGVIIKRIVIRVIKETKIDEWLHEKRLKEAIGNHDLSAIIGSFSKWYVIAIFLAQAVELIQMNFLRNFMQFVIELINRGIAAILLLIGGLLLARYIRHVIERTEYAYKKTLAAVAEFLVVYIVIVIALQTIGVDATILLDAFRIGFTVLVIALAIIAGLLFAFAFKKDIVNAVSDIRKEFNK